MARVRGTDTYISLNAVDLSQYLNNAEFNRTSDVGDITGFGKNSHVKQGLLLDSKGSIEGIYDNTASTGPRAVIEPLIGTTVTLIRRPEGTGTGKPQDSVSVVVVGYKETSPVAEFVKFAVELEGSDDVTTTSQA
jgi:hypothetical protein